MQRPTFPDITRYWGSRKALEAVRENVLVYAREAFKGRQQEALETQHQAMASGHTGTGHLAFFNDQLLPILKSFQKKPTVLELGAGMAWQSALMAAHGAQNVLATEFCWNTSSPYNIGNIHTFYRLAQQDPLLDKVLTFTRQENGDLKSVKFPDNMALLCNSAEEVPISSGSVDFVYSYNCIEHFSSVKYAFSEVYRLLNPGGIFYSSTEPLFYSAYGHHLAEIYPLPWGHLLWEVEDLIALVLKETGGRVEWAPGVPMTEEHLHQVLNHELNFTTPKEIRQGLRQGGQWKVEGWVDLWSDNEKQLAKQFGLLEALKGLSEEELFLHGMVFRLRRVEKAPLFQPPLQLSATHRRFLKRLKPPFLSASTIPLA